MGAWARSSGDPPPDRPKGAWHRRRPLLLGCAVAAILAVTIIGDLPQHTAIPQQVAEETTVIGSIKADAAGCVYAVQEAFGFYGDARRGTLSTSDRAGLPALFGDDESACSLISESIYDLSGIEVPGSAAGRDIGEVVNTVTIWVTSDALAAIDAIHTLTTDITNTQALTALAKAERRLASDRATVSSELAAADHVLDGAHLAGPGLPSLPLPTSASAS